MEWFLVTWSIYRRVFGRAGSLAVKNWPVMATVFVYSAVMKIAVLAALSLGIAGGFILSLVSAACIGSLLYLVETMVRTTRVTLEDFQHSFGVYLWDVVGVAFLWWVFSMIAVPALSQLPQGPIIWLCIRLAIFVLFNAVPELIYLGHYSSMQLLSESYAFIGNNWAEWIPAYVVALVILYASPVWALPLGDPAAAIRLAAVSLLIYFGMVMRGLLFLELHGSSRRGRAFKYRIEN